MYVRMYLHRVRTYIVYVPTSCTYLTGTHTAFVSSKTSHKMKTELGGTVSMECWGKYVHYVK